MIVGTVFLFAEPSIDIGNDALFSEKVEIRRTIVVVFDISLSMDSSIGTNSSSNTNPKRRFDVARDSLIIFLEEQENIRVGIILFSSVAFQYRRPTSDIDSLIIDVSRLAIQRSAEGGLGRNQMVGLANQTETAQALTLAQGVLEDLPLANKRSRAVILITDLNDSTDEISNAIKELTHSDIRVFVLSIKNRTANLAPREQALDTLPNVYVYAVSSPEDLGQVYSEISRIEKEELVVRELISARQNIVAEIAFALFIVSVVFALSAEIFFRTVRKE
ncbi:VWA domain-containing protein [Patescibacteria group bacterium]|nr:VWA domain-containing protein [Patescibacteria group bacterium]